MENSERVPSGDLLSEDPASWQATLIHLKQHGCPSTWDRRAIWCRLLGQHSGPSSWQWRSVWTLYKDVRGVAGDFPAAQKFCLAQVGEKVHAGERI
jgi:hypothetical protein